MVIQSLQSDEKGQALIEFAFALPILLLILTGIIEFGRIFHTNIIIEQAARAGARVATVNQDPDEVKAIVQAAGSSVNIDTENIIVAFCDTPTCDPSNPGASETSGERGDSAVVEVTYEMDLLTPLIRPFLASDDGKYEIQSRMVMRVE